MMWASTGCFVESRAREMKLASRIFNLRNLLLFIRALIPNSFSDFVPLEFKKQDMRGVPSLQEGPHTLAESAKSERLRSFNSEAFASNLNPTTIRPERS